MSLHYPDGLLLRIIMLFEISENPQTILYFEIRWNLKLKKFNSFSIKLFFKIFFINEDKIRKKNLHRFIFEEVGIHKEYQRYLKHS
jgi:hypothetical protein